MTDELDKIDESFKKSIQHGLAKWRSPNDRNRTTTKSHLILVEGMYAFKACRSVSNSGTFDLENEAHFSKYPPCEECENQLKRFKSSDH